jgi:hypothetical protein
MPPAVILCWLIADRGLDLTGFLTLLVYPTNRAPAGAVADREKNSRSTSLTWRNGATD